MPRTRAYRRHQRARTKARHLRDWRTLMDPIGYPPPKDIAKRHPLDCGQHCQLCHYEKWMPGRRRARENRQWRRG